MKKLKLRVIKKLNDIIDDIDNTFQNLSAKECESELGELLFHVESEADSIIDDLKEQK